MALAEASAIHFLAGAASGAIGAAITGRNVGLGALTGGVSAGLAEGMGGALSWTQWHKDLAPVEKIFAGLVSRVGIGAVTGGVTSEIVRGQFLAGFGQGAWTAAYGFLFNWGLHEGPTLMTAGNDGGHPSFYDDIPIKPYDSRPSLFEFSALCVSTAAVIVYGGEFVLGLAYTYPEAIIFTAGAAEGITPTYTGTTVNAYGYVAGAGTSLYYFGW